MPRPMSWSCLPPQLDGEDGTHCFKALPATKTKAARDGFLEMNYTAEWEYKMDEHDVTLNGKNFTCMAKMKNFPALSKSVNMEVVCEQQNIFILSRYWTLHHISLCNDPHV